MLYYIYTPPPPNFPDLARVAIIIYLDLTEIGLGWDSTRTNWTLLGLMAELETISVVVVGLAFLGKEKTVPSRSLSRKRRAIVRTLVYCQYSEEIDQPA